MLSFSPKVTLNLRWIAVLGVLMSVSMAKEIEALEVTAVDPLALSAASPTTSITIHFDEPVLAASVDSSSFRAFGRWSGPVSGTFTITGQSVELVPTRPFSAGETVLVNLSRDLTAVGGSNLRSAGYAYQFGIVAAPATRDFTQIDEFDVRGKDPNTRLYGAVGTDLNLDGWLDLTAVNEDTGDLRIFLNLADGSGLMGAMVEPPTAVGFGASPNEPGDFDNDGLPDIATADFLDDTVSIVLGNGDGTFQPRQIVGVGEVPHGLAALDFDGDADIDLVSANAGGNNLTLMVNNGSGSFSVLGTIEGGGNGEWALSAADLNGDSIFDLVVGTRADGDVHVLLGNGDGTFATPVTRVLGAGVWMLVLGDVNGDGKMDVSTANGMSESGSILLGNGDGTLAAPETVGSPGHTPATDLADLDGDGDLDWVLSVFGAGLWEVYENNGAGAFTLDQQISAEENPSCALALDLDNDGVIDLALTDEIADTILLLKNAPVQIFSDGFESGDTAGWSFESP